ncbi:MAG: nitrogenase associated protein [Anaerolineae bacterium]|nr:nitrogenase associated protein [Anaerolineae bacterium]
MVTKQNIQQKCHDPYLRCALYGAAQTALGVKGCCVLSHSPQGCFQLVGSAFGWQDADYTETVTLCTKLCEDEIVYGGESMLARTIREAHASLDVPVMFIVTACGPEIVGDDVEAVAEDLQDEVRFPIVPIPCAGFRGDQNRGTDIALDAILDHLAPAGGRGRSRRQKTPRSVCLIAPHANANPTWTGDLAWVKSMLAQMGATVVISLTHDTLLSDFAELPQVEGSLVLSHDAGQNAADTLAERYGIAQWCRELPLPIGFSNTRAWLLAVGERLGATEVAQKIIAHGESMVVEACRRKGLEQSAMHRATAAIVADATVGIPLLRFITEDLEMIPKLVCLRSGLPGAEEILAREVAALDLDVPVISNSDVYQARAALAEVMPDMVLGSNIERHAAEALEIPYVFRLVTPISRFRMTDRAYWGYTGMLNLIEAVQNDWLDRYRSKRRRYKARW